MRNKKEIQLPIAVQFITNGNTITSVNVAITEGKAPTLNIASGTHPELEAQIRRWFASYSAGQHPSEVLPIDLSSFPPYTRKVLAAIQTIPFGKTMTYQEVARLTRNPDAARAVGNACARNPCLLVIPCHRILAQGSSLGGFSAGLGIKRILLDFEGSSVN